MTTNNSTEFDVMGLVIFDRSDLPEVITASDKLTAGETTILRSQTPSLSYEMLRDRSMETMALALAVRDMQSSPELEQMVALIKANSAHSDEEARAIALGMLKNGVSGGF